MKGFLSVGGLIEGHLPGRGWAAAVVAAASRAMRRVGRILTLMAPYSSEEWDFGGRDWVFGRYRWGIDEGSGP